MPVPDVVRQRLQPLGSLATSNRIFLYSIFSTFAVAGTILNALRSYSNLYSVAIYLSRSSRSVLILANFGFLFALLCGRILQRVFFGPLQAREVERLYDQTWIFVTESLLAFTIFRDDFDIPFVLMFGFLLFVKCFHWLMADRVETMDQTTYPGPPTIFHIRINSLFCLLWIIDIVMFAFAVDSTLSNGVGGMVLFASEYAILIASALNSMARYILSVIDFRRMRTRGGENAAPMENKSMYIFYIELVTDFLKLTTYLTFFLLILTFYGLPLNIVRDVYLTARSFITRLRALVRYHNATRDMDRRYPDATEAELAEMSDRTCIICREEMVSRVANAGGEDLAETQAQAPDGPNMTPKKLPCGHIFHFQCLRSWLERQQSCPTCRRTVLETNPPNEPAAQGRQGQGGGGAPAGPPAGDAGAAGRAALPRRGRIAQWLNPFLGIPMAGAPGQGQPVNGQIPPPMAPLQHQPLPNAAWAPGQPPPFYYPVHYPPQQPQQLQPPPVFRGFYGPNGAWQPWGLDLQLLDQAQHQHRANAPAEPQPQATVPTPTVRTEAASDAAGTPPVDAAPTLTTSSSDAPNEEPTTPREVAALAALRRLESSRPTVEPASSRGETPTGSISAASAPPSATVQPTAGSSTTAASSSDRRPELPTLIPLYDFSSIHQPPFSSHQNPFVVPPFSRHPAQNNRTPQTHIGSSTLAAQSSPRHERAASDPAASQTVTALEQLPAVLTDDQLTRLDRLTREAIDERLRVLENVSGAVHRCIEELTRVRSALPALVASAVPATQSQVTEASSIATNVAATATIVNGSSTHAEAVKPSASNGHAASESSTGPGIMNTNPAPEESVGSTSISE